jgi:hypothetical protein
MDEIISYKMCAVKVRNAKLRNYLKVPVNRLMTTSSYRNLLRTVSLSVLVLLEVAVASLLHVNNLVPMSEQLVPDFSQQLGTSSANTS